MAKISRIYCIRKAQKLEDNEKKTKESFSLMLNAGILYESQNAVLELV